MNYIKDDQPMNLPFNYKLNDGTTQIGFDRLTDAARIALAGVYPLVEAQTIEAWQSKSSPTYDYTATECLVTYTLTDTPLDLYKQQKIGAVYQAAKELLDAQAEGYGLAEIATWPAISADVVAYNIDATVGVAMQAALDTSSYDAAGLAAVLTPRINKQLSILANRAALSFAINAAADHAAVAAIDLTLGW